MQRPDGEMSELAEGARLLSEYTGLNLYRGFNSLSLRHISTGYVQNVARFFGRFLRSPDGSAHYFAHYRQKYLQKQGYNPAAMGAR